MFHLHRTFTCLALHLPSMSGHRAPRRGPVAMRRRCLFLHGFIANLVLRHQRPCLTCSVLTQNFPKVIGFSIAWLPPLR